MMYLPYQERVIDELRELSEKRKKLGAYIESDLWNTVPFEEQGRMLKQLRLMVEYMLVLEDRIQHFSNGFEEIR